MLTFFFLLFEGVELVYVKADEQQSCYEEGMASTVVLRLWKDGTGSKMSLPAWQEKLVICFTHNMKLHTYWICSRN